MAIQDSDLFLVNRLGYPQITPLIGPIIDVGVTTGVDYAQYSKVWNIDADQEYTGNLWNTGSENLDINNIFDGNENTGFFAIADPKTTDIEFRFFPPSPIKVDGLIEIKGGVDASFGSTTLAQLWINGELIIEDYGKDEDPVWLSGSYSGLINEIRFTQKEKVQSRRFSIFAFKIDGEYLVSNQQVTYLEFGSNDDFDKFNLFDHIKECDASGNLLDATGTVGEVLPAQNRITLTKNEPNWGINNYVQGRTQDDTTGTAIQTSHHVRADELEAKMGDNDLMLVNRVNNGEYASYKANKAQVFGELNGTDHLLVNRNNASFHCTGADFNEYFNSCQVRYAPVTTIDFPLQSGSSIANVYNGLVGTDPGGFDNGAASAGNLTGTYTFELTYSFSNVTKLEIWGSASNIDSTKTVNVYVDNGSGYGPAYTMPHSIPIDDRFDVSAALNGTNIAKIKIEYILANSGTNICAVYINGEMLVDCTD